MPVVDRLFLVFSLVIDVKIASKIINKLIKMLFSEFKKYIPIIQNASLGGLEAQFLLAPTYRKKYDLDLIQATAPTLASVLILFFANEKNQTSFVLTERANYNGHHAKQISFPGGKKNTNDIDLIRTAIRETREEIGLEVIPTQIFKQLTNIFIPPSNFLAHPFLAVYDAKPNFKKNYEVESILTPTIEELVDNTNIQERKVAIASGKLITTPCFVFDNMVVWGATAMMLSELRELLLRSII